MPHAGVFHPAILLARQRPTWSASTCGDVTAGHRRPGWPTVANIVRAGDDGRPERVFMQESSSGRRSTARWSRITTGWPAPPLGADVPRPRKARYGLQLPLFDEVDGGVGGEAGDFCGGTPDRPSNPAYALRR